MSFINKNTLNKKKDYESKSLGKCHMSPHLIHKILLSFSCTNCANSHTGAKFCEPNQCGKVLSHKQEHVPLPKFFIGKMAYVCTKCGTSSLRSHTSLYNRLFILGKNPVNAMNVREISPISQNSGGFGELMQVRSPIYALKVAGSYPKDTLDCTSKNS